MNNKLARAQVIVSGLVQGVFFRAETRHYAQRLNLNGWVKNRPDGKVEAVFEGNRSDIEKMLQWCKRGPAGAVVDDVEIGWEEYTGECRDFHIR